MNHRNLNFFKSTNHWNNDELTRYITSAAELLDLQEHEQDFGRRAELWQSYEAALAPLVIWQDDNVRQEITRSIALWSTHASTRLLRAYHGLVERLDIRTLRAALRILVDSNFRQGETLSFAVAARRARDYNKREAGDLGVTLTYLSGLEGGGSSAMTMADRLTSLGLQGSRFAEAAARISADESPSMLAAALDAVDLSWRHNAVDPEDVKGFLDDLALRVDQATLLRTLDKMRAPPTGPLLGDVLRLFVALDFQAGGKWADDTLSEFGGRPRPEAITALLSAQGRISLSSAPPPPANKPISSALFRRAHRMDEVQGNA